MGDGRGDGVGPSRKVEVRGGVGGVGEKSYGWTVQEGAKGPERLEGRDVSLFGSGRRPEDHGTQESDDH